MLAERSRSHALSYVKSEQTLGNKEKRVLSCPGRKNKIQSVKSAYWIGVCISINHKLQNHLKS